MREFWLTDANDSKWSLATTSPTPFVDVKGLGSKSEISYWQGTYVSVPVKKTITRLSCSGTIWFLQGDKSFEDFERWIGEAEYTGTIWFWCRRDGCSPKRCKIQIESLDRSEKVGSIFTASISMARLTPWYGTYHEFKDSDGLIETNQNIIFYKGDVNGAIKLDGDHVYADAAAETIDLKCVDSAGSISEFKSTPSSVTADDEIFEISFFEGNQIAYIGDTDLYSSQDFTKSGFVSLHPGKNIFTYSIGEGRDHTLSWYDEFSEA